MMPRLFLALAAGSAVLLVGAVVMATAIPDRPAERPYCGPGSILARTTDCRSQ
jgi:hypothetical protein